MLFADVADYTAMSEKLDPEMDYTALGDTTNLASKMESAAKPGSIL